jgi:hypothetical protein
VRATDGTESSFIVGDSPAPQLPGRTTVHRIRG